MRTFAITFDYRCPFARNANEHVVAGLLGGAAWYVTFVPFCLGQVHVDDGETPIWDHPDDDSGLLALQVGAALYAVDPQGFPPVHRDLFALRHDRGGNLRDAELLREVVAAHDVDTDAVFAMVDDGRALKLVRDAHEAAASDHDVWGVPTFIAGDAAVFVRLMSRPDGEGAEAVRTVERVLDLLDGFTDLNEFKHTSVPR